MVDARGEAMTVANFPNRSEWKPGLYPGLDRPEYESIPAINVSTLEHFEKSAAHAREAMLHPRKPTDAMDFGTALHCAVLEPARFSKLYAAAPKVDRRTKAGKETWAAFEAEHAESICLDSDDFICIQRMRESVWSHGVAKQMLGGLGHNEVGVVSEDPEFGLLRKSLLDRISNFDGWTWIIDVKSTQDASPRGFARACRNLHYGAKAAFYIDNCNAVAPRERRFAWIAIEKEAPYAVAVYEADDTALSAGRSKWQRWMYRYAEAVRTNSWPGYELNVHPLGSDETEWHS
jgi:hypothetical protein